MGDLRQPQLSKPEDEVKVPLQVSVTSQASSMSSLAAPPDGGWGWVVCGAAFVVMAVLDGMMFSFGVFFLELLSYFGDSKGKTAMVGSVLMGTHLMLGPVISTMVNSFGIRPVAFTGALVAGTAFAVSTMASSIPMLIVTYGLLAGIGISMLYIPSLLAVGFYFEKRRALANGITASGSGIGTFLYSPLCIFLQTYYSWKGSLLILSGLVLNCAVCGALYRPLEARPRRRPKDQMQMESEVVETDPLFENKKLGGLTQSDISQDLMLRHPYLSSLKAQSLNEFPVQNSPFRSYDNISDNTSTYSVTCTEPDSTSYCHEIPSTNQYINSTPVNMGSPFLRPSDYYKKVLDCDVRTSVSSDNVYRAMRARKQRSRCQSPVIPRPLIRQDLFYSGSLNRIPQYRDNPSIRSLAYREPEDDVISVMSQGRSSRLCNFLERKVGISLLRNPVFLLTMFSMVLWTTHSTILTVLPDYARLIGCDETESAILLSIIGVTNTGGRIFAGWLSDRPDVDVVRVNMAALITGSLTIFTMPFTSNFAVLVCQAAIFGLCMATWTSLRPIVLVELLGVANLTNAFGLVALFQGMSLCVGPPIAGLLYDVTGSYVLPFMLASAAFFLSGLLCLFLRRVARWHAGGTLQGAVMTTTVD